MKNGKLKSAVRSLQQQSWQQMEQLGRDEIQILKGGTHPERSNCHTKCGSNGTKDREENEEIHN